MELDDYRTMIRKYPVDRNRALNTPGMQVLLSRKTRNVVGKISRNLLLEIIFTIFFIAVALFFMLQENTLARKIIPGLMVVYGVGFLSYLNLLLKHVRSYNISSPIKTNLQALILIITRFRKVYLQLTMVMIPVMILVAIVHVYSSSAMIFNSGYKVLVSRPALIFFSVSLLWYAMMYMFTRWYTGKFYGKQLESLQQQLADLKN